MDALAILRTGTLALLGLAALVFALAGVAELRAVSPQPGYLLSNGSTTSVDGFCRVSWDTGDEWLLTALTPSNGGNTVAVGHDDHARCTLTGAADGAQYRATRANDSRTGSCAGTLTPDHGCARVVASGDVLTRLAVDNGIEGLPVWSEFPDHQRTRLVEMFAGPMFFLVPVVVVFAFALAAWREWTA